MPLNQETKPKQKKKKANTLQIKGSRESSSDWSRSLNTSFFFFSVGLSLKDFKHSKPPKKQHNKNKTKNKPKTTSFWLIEHDVQFWWLYAFNNNEKIKKRT